jgi:hypothetical protein
MPLIRPESIAFDIDGVVADTMTLFLRIARDKYGAGGYTLEDITSYDLEMCLDMGADTIARVVVDLLEGNHEGPLLPNPGAVEFLSRLGRGHGPVVFVTARPSASHIGKWLSDTLSMPSGDFDLVATGSFEAKCAVLKEKGRSVFVEDRLETCFLLADAGITPIVYRQPWNRASHPFAEVGSLAELEGMVAFP